MVSGKLVQDQLRRLSANPLEDATELFRRMCFNALISNTDDHPRNHAIIAKNDDWRLSPVYDLTPSVPISTEQRYLAMSCGDYGNYANAKNILSQSARFLLSNTDASSIITTMEQKVRNHWYAIAKSAGVSNRDCEQISGAFIYPGFNMQSE